jgi:hypothetical protein
MLETPDLFLSEMKLILLNEFNVSIPNSRSSMPCIEKGGQRRQLDEKPKRKTQIYVMITVI